VIAWFVAGAGWRRTAAQLAWVLLAVALVLTPWTVRNIVRMHAPIVLSSNLGDTFCISRHHGATGEFEYCKSDVRKVVRLDRVAARDYEVKQANANLKQAVRFVIHHPGEEFTLVFKRAYYAYDHDRDGLTGVESNGADRFLGARLRRTLGIVADVWFFGTLALGIIGLPAFFRDSRTSPRRLFFVLCLLTFAAVPLGLYGLQRFHVPVLPLLCVSAAVPIVRWWERRRSDPARRPDLRAAASGSG
jgi:hypothetical protein